LKIIEKRTGLKCSLVEGAARIHDPAMEKMVGRDPLDEPLQKIEFRDATIEEVLETLSKMTGFELAPQMISHGVGGRKATFSLDKATLRQVLSTASQKFGSRGFYTVVFKVFPKVDPTSPVRLGVSF
jgi:hypothetical protein